MNEQKKLTESKKKLNFRVPLVALQLRLVYYRFWFFLFLWKQFRQWTADWKSLLRANNREGKTRNESRNTNYTTLSFSLFFLSLKKQGDMEQHTKSNAAFLIFLMFIRCFLLCFDFTCLNRGSRADADLASTGQHSSWTLGCSLQRPSG